MKLVAKALVVVAAAGGLLVVSLYLRGGDDKIPGNILTKKNPLSVSDEVLAKGKKAYSDNCVQCHGETGKGDGPMSGMLKQKPADINDSTLVGGLTDGEIYWAVTKGKDKVMPPFESKLTEEERWSLVVFVRDLSKTKSNNTPRPGRE